MASAPTHKCEQLTCSVCCEQFDSDKRQPKLLPCTHSFCLGCLKALNKETEFSCPSCRTTIRINPDQLPKNQHISMLLDGCNNVVTQSIAGNRISVSTDSRGNIRVSLGVGSGSGRCSERLTRDQVAHYLADKSNLAALQGARLSDLDLRNMDFSNMIMQGSDLRGADLSGSNLSRTNLQGCDLRRVKLRGVRMQRANFTGADLRECDFQKADLTGTSFTGADLRHSNFSNSNLSHTNFTGATLKGCDLRGSNMQGIDLTGADMRHVSM